MGRRISVSSIYKSISLFLIAVTGGCEARSGTDLKSSQPAMAPAGPTWLQLDGEDFNFGQTLLRPNEVARQVISLKNVGPAALTFQEPDVTCGCVTVELSSRSLQPGQSAELSAVVRPTTFGAIHHRVLLRSNDPVRPVVELRVIGELVQRVQSEPRQLDLGEVLRGARVERNVWVEVGLLSSEQRAPEVHAAPASDTIEIVPTGEVEQIIKNGIPRTRAKYRLTLNLNAGSGDGRSFVDFQTPDASYRMPLTWSQTANVNVLPRPVIVHGFAGAGYSGQAALSYTTPPRSRPTVRQASARNGALSATLSGTDDPDRFQLVVNIVPEAGTTFVAGTVEIETFDPDEPLIEVPVYGLVQTP